jgi:hypothetical protein
MIVEAPQLVIDRIVTDFIEGDDTWGLFRWVYELDACRLDWRRRDGVCPCGEYVS